MKTRVSLLLLFIFGLFAPQTARADGGQVEVYLQVRPADQTNPKERGKAPRIEATVVGGAKTTVDKYSISTVVSGQKVTIKADKFRDYSEGTETIAIALVINGQEVWIGNEDVEKDANARYEGVLHLDYEPSDVSPRGRSRAQLHRGAAAGRPDPFAPVAGAGPAPALRDPPRHHHRRHPLRRRRGDGRRPPGHGRHLDRPPRHGEGLPGRPLQRRGHRRRGRAGHGDGQAVPAAARALREGRGRRRSAWRARPTSCRRWCAANLPMAMQGFVVVPLFAGYDLRRAGRPHLHLRRHRRPLRGDRLPRRRLGQPRRRDDHQARLARRT